MMHTGRPAGRQAGRQAGGAYPELLLERHDELDRVQRVRVEVFDEVGVDGNGALLVELFPHDLNHLCRVEFVSRRGAAGRGLVGCKSPVLFRKWQCMALVNAPDDRRNTHTSRSSSRPSDEASLHYQVTCTRIGSDNDVNTSSSTRRPRAANGDEGRVQHGEHVIGRKIAPKFWGIGTAVCSTLHVFTFSQPLLRIERPRNGSDERGILAQLTRVHFASFLCPANPYETKLGVAVKAFKVLVSSVRNVGRSFMYFVSIGR